MTDRKPSQRVSLGRPQGPRHDGVGVGVRVREYIGEGNVNPAAALLQTHDSKTIVARDNAVGWELSPVTQRTELSGRKGLEAESLLTLEGCRLLGA